MEEPFFKLEKSMYYRQKYTIYLNHEKFLFPTGTSGSFNVFVARVMNLSYAQFLRYCRDELGAELIGKNTRYIVPYFDNTEEVRLLIKILNKRMEYIMDEQKDPYEYYKEADGTITAVPLDIK